MNWFTPKRRKCAMADSSTPDELDNRKGNKHPNDHCFKKHQQAASLINLYYGGIMIICFDGRRISRFYELQRACITKDKRSLSGHS